MNKCKEPKECEICGTQVKGSSSGICHHCMLKFIADDNREYCDHCSGPYIDPSKHLPQLGEQMYLKFVADWDDSDSEPKWADLDESSRNLWQLEAEKLRDQRE